MSTEGTYLIEIERHYVATIEVDADRKANRTKNGLGK